MGQKVNKSVLNTVCCQYDRDKEAKRQEGYFPTEDFKIASTIHHISNFSNAYG